MKISVNYFVGLLLFSGVVLSCEKDNGDIPGADIQGEVEFYLLDFYENLDSTPAIDLTSIVLSEDALLSYEELKTYNAREYFFNITSEAKDKIEGMAHSVSGVAFAVTANEDVVYTGYFVPSYSSIALQWIVIDPLFWHLTKRMHVNLGYPGTIEGSDIPDLRNDERILEIFRRDRKLVE